MNVLVACEESQTVCSAFRALGHRAFSADLQLCSGGHPEWHIVGDCLPLINGGCQFVTQAGTKCEQHGMWDLLIAHPPCTYMSKAGARWLYKGGVLSENRLQLGLKAKAFFYSLYNARCNHIAIENPVPIKIIGLPRPSTVVQPYEFGEPFSKKTYLWLKGLPPLLPTLIVSSFSPFCPSKRRTPDGNIEYVSGVNGSKARSKTFKGIAAAMASQWSAFIEEEEKKTLTLTVSRIKPK